MTRLETISLEDLHDALRDATGKRETQRLMVAILYKRGPSVPMIAEWYGFRAATIYRWFDRLESESIREAVRDRPRPGRPPKLVGEQRRRFEEALREPPTEYGYDVPEWTPEIARDYLEDAFGVTYTSRHVRRLLAELSDR